jgi:FkbM family methyltransferase
MDRRSFLAGALAGAAGVGITQVVRTPPDTPPPVLPPPAPRQPHGSLSYSQQGEDIVLYHLLRDGMKIANPTYVDIGASDPIESSNTYLLYWAGGHGVLVEPNPMYREPYRTYRPLDIVVSAGIGIDGATEADYYVIRGEPTLNTFSADDVAVRRARAGRDIVERVVKMPLVSVNHVMATCLGKAPDLLSIDVEGMDLAILRTLDFQTYRPAVIIAETNYAGPTGPPSPIANLLFAHRYVVCGGSMYNTIFADPARYA